MVVSYLSTGTYTVRLRVRDDKGAYGYDTCTVYVVSIGITMAPGESSYVGVNNDDDNENGIMDMCEDGAVDGENDLRRVLLSVITPKPTDKVYLSLVPQGEPQMQVWGEADRQGLLISTKDGPTYVEWPSGNVPTEVNIEASSCSGPVDNKSLWLTYTGVDYNSIPPSEYPVDRNPPAKIDFTCVELDMDMDGVNDDYYGPSLEKTDETVPGGFVPLNGLVQITLQPVLPTALQIDESHPVIFDVPAGSSKILIWEMTGDPVILPKYYYSRADLPDYLWVEGVETSADVRDITLALEYTIAGNMFEDRIRATVFKLDIEIYTNGSWHNVTDDNITVLNGTKYQFRAIFDPTFDPWPSDKFSWSGAASGSEQIVEVTFGSIGSQTLTATFCSCSKNVTINVIVPQIDEVAFVSGSGATSYDIYDGAERWRKGRTGQTAENEPASFKKGAKTAVTAKFWHQEYLTFSTPVTIRGYVYICDYPATGGSYPEQDATFGTSWPSPSSSVFIASSSNATDAIYWDYVDIDWHYKVPSGTNSWVDAGYSSNLKYYLVYDAPKCSSSNYTKSNLDEAVKKAKSESTESGIASKANDNVGDNVYEGCICGSGFQVNFDAAMGRYPSTGDKGMCCCRAEGLDCVLNVLGIGPYTHDYVNENPEPNPQLVYTDPCAICGKDCDRNYWDSFWNNWEGVVKAGGNGSTCYAPANGSITIDEGTYSQIDGRIAIDCGYYWAWGPNKGNVCSHLPAP